MKKIIVLLFFIGFSFQSHAQIPVISVITTLVKKVINAIDLEVENLQNRTIWLQDAQKALENAMSQLQLDGISDWVKQTKDLYSDYYQELSTVKQIIADYDKVKQVIKLQENIISEYNAAYSKFKQDKNFSSSEITYMYNVYAGILNESLKNVSQVLLVVNAFITQMSDAGRMNIINNAAANIQKNYNDLKQFNSQNIQISIQRSIEKNDYQTVKKLYGLP